MSGLDRLSTPGSLALGAANPLAAAANAAGRSDARSLAGTAIGEIGHRVLAWVGQSVRSSDTASNAWAASSGVTSDFRADPRELERRGDVYGLRDLASSITSQAGGTPTQEGELRRALEDFTRQAVVQLAGLSGGDADRQLGGMRDALSGALEAPAGEGVDGVVARLHAATATLSTANGA